MARSVPPRVRVVEVGPRDGLQNESGAIATATRVALIERLAACGLPAVESGAFVSPRWVPRMADTAEVLQRMARRPGVDYPVLVPNLKGLEAAVELERSRGVPVGEVAVFAAATESFSMRNTHCTIAQSLERLGEVARAASEQGWRVRGYVSVALGCPYEGEVDPQSVLRVSEALLECGCYEVSIGDTIGVATPGQVVRLFERLCRGIEPTRLAGHFHDTWGQALANALAMLDFGVATLDASVAGLGGCPYAPGATGNVATEDLVYLLHGLGVHTGVDLDALVDTGAWICEQLGRANGSRVARATLARRAARASADPASTATPAAGEPARGRA